MSDRDRSDAELTTLVAELRDTLDELQGTVEPGPPSRRPPAAGELLRFTESYTIPTLLSILEASIRALELLQATLRLVDGRPLDTDRRDRRERSGDTAARVGSLGRTTVDRVDTALSELTAALEGEPPEGEARDLLTEAKSLREEVDRRIREAERDGRGGGRRRRPVEADTARRASDGVHEIPVTAEGAPTPDTEDVDAPTADESEASVDVDAELESIREEVEEERERSANWEPGAGDAGDGDDGTDRDSEAGEDSP